MSSQLEKASKNYSEIEIKMDVERSCCALFFLLGIFGVFKTTYPPGSWQSIAVRTRIRIKCTDYWLSLYEDRKHD